MNYMRDPKNHGELVEDILKIHKIDKSVGAQALATEWPLTARTARSVVTSCKRKEIHIYRDSLKITQLFTPEDLEDMSFARKAFELLNR